MKTAIALVLSGALLVFALSPAQADDTDIFGANVQPNVMILFDSSGSMSQTVDSHPYEVARTYEIVNKCGKYRNQACTSTVVYNQTGTDRYELYKTTISDVSSSAARTALNTTGFWSGKISGSTVSLFSGNYLNYKLGFCPTALCTEKKIDIAKRVVKNLIDNTPGVRFGVMRFGAGIPGSENGSGQMVAEIGTSAGAMKAAIDAITPSGWTPLGEQLYDGGQYFKGLPFLNGTQFPSPITLECQPNFIILVTDGQQNGPAAAGTHLLAGNMQTEAGRRFDQDHSSSLTGKQNVIVHTVGFGISATEKAAANADLQDAANKGGGSFYYAKDSQQLEAALQDAIRKVLAATFTFATPVLPSTSTTGSTKAYLAAFQSDPTSPFWHGFLKAYQRDALGQVPVDPVTGVPLPSALVWEAGQQLSVKAESTRTIFTVTGGTVTGGTRTGATPQDFTKGNAAITAALLGVDATERDKVIDFTRGLDAYDRDLDGITAEERAWKLGDIFHSTPVLVTPPSLALNDASYWAYRQAQQSRTTVLIAGANDGMLHAFREIDGEELWAFIPPDLLGSLHALTVRSAEHPYFVDSSPIAADIKVGGAWKTIVVFGLRRGGAFYYALDITDITNPIFLWSFTDPKMGETWSEPAIGKVQVGASEKFVAFVGGGYDTGTNNATGKAFFVIDLATGEKLWEYTNDGAADDRQYMNFSLAANSTAADLDHDGFIDRVYIGDVGGQLWKFDVSALSIAEWAGKRLFVTSRTQANPPAAGAFYPARPIYGAPALALDEQGRLWVFFGSGDRNHPNNTGSNRFYGIMDTSTMANGDAWDRSDLTDEANDDQGWTFRLKGDNEKVLAAANVFNKVVFFSTFTPTSVVACGTGGGTAKLYAVQLDTGFAAINFATGEELVTTDDKRVRRITVGSGIASMPVIVITYPASGDAVATVTTSVVTATTSQELRSNPAPPPSTLKRLLYWREVPRF